MPSGKTPEEMLKSYGELILANKYADAYKLLPLDKQQSYGDAAAYEAQVKAYGITAFNMGKAAVDGDTTTIVSEQVTPTCRSPTPGRSRRLATSGSWLPAPWAARSSSRSTAARHCTVAGRPNGRPVVRSEVRGAC